jgi:MYXO-CTERM domain-containing protein
MDLAFAARDVDVASLVKGSLPDGMTLSTGTPAGPPRIPPTGGCAGCSTAPGADDYATAGLFALGFLVMTRKRRD